MYLVDSSIWIRILRRRAYANLQEMVIPHLMSGNAAVNKVVRTEVLVGARDEREYGAFAWQLDTLTDLAIGDSTWSNAAELGYRLRRVGFTTGIPDLLIAASAIEHDAVLMHADSDFDRIAQHSDLRVESYVESV
jgi:predicted nucleic acid-binding protein